MSGSNGIREGDEDGGARADRAGSAPAIGDVSTSLGNDFESGAPNRRGGPRTAQGKQASSKNACRFGILSPDPSAGGESTEDYQAFLAGIRAHFQPVGSYEEELVANIVNEFWALHRITRATSALIDLRAKRIDPPPRISVMKPILERNKWSAYARPLESYVEFKLLDTEADGLLFSPEIVGDVMRAAEEAGFTMPIMDSMSLTSDGAQFVRKFLTLTAMANGVDKAKVVRKTSAVLKMASDLACGAEQKIKRLQREQAKRDKRAATSNLPDLDDYDRLVRYKRSHERSLEKWVSALEVSQRARSGELDPPIRVHVSEG